MKAIQMILMGWLGSGLWLMGCAGDMERVGNASRPGRAVRSPVETNSTSGEMAMASAMEGVPLVTVGFPNRVGEEPVVRTIVDNMVRPPEGGGLLQPVRGQGRPIPATGITVTTSTQPAIQSATQPTTRPNP